MEQDDFDTILTSAEHQMVRLKHLYDQWFQGFERLEPTIPRKQFDRTMHVLHKSKPGTTVLRFRYQNLKQRYVTLQSYWRRVARQIEEGTYRRDLQRVRWKKEKAQRLAEEQLKKPFDLEADHNIAEVLAEAEKLVDDFFPSISEKTSEKKLSKPPKKKTSTAKTAARKKSKPPARARRKTPPPVPDRSSDIDEARLRQIYQDYVKAKKSNNESTEKLSYERVARGIKKMVPKLEREHGTKKVDFKIVMKDGKVGLKPVVKPKSDS